MTIIRLFDDLLTKHLLTFGPSSPAALMPAQAAMPAHSTFFSSRPAELRISAASGLPQASFSGQACGCKGACVAQLSRHLISVSQSVLPAPGLLIYFALQQSMTAYIMTLKRIPLTQCL